MPEAGVRRGVRLGRRFFATGPVTLAQALLGQRLVRVLDDGTRLAGIIVETEAYLGIEDRAAHSFGGRRTERVAAMYGPPGTVYVYFVYGVHYCMNIVCGREGEPVAVLLRALEPVEGVETMRRLRYPGVPPTRVPADNSDLCSGPGKICRALAIDMAVNGLDLAVDTRMGVERNRRAAVAEDVLGNSPRIGVDYAGEWARRPLRWFLQGNAHVSGRQPKPRAARGRKARS
jgi:DNA-3-methyladenine glycosylase